MRSGTLCSHLLFATGLCITSVVVAHENDPKGTAERIPYEGPSWRSDVDGGLAGGFDSLNINLAANITMTEIDPGQDGNDIWGYTSPSGREYAIMGTTSGTSFIEVTQAGNPQIIQYIDGPNSLWRDMKVYGEYAYIVSEGGGDIQIVSMANIDNGVVTLVNSIGDGGTAATHNVAIDTVSGILARCGGGPNGIRLYSLASDPANPQYVGAWNDEYVHDAQLHTMTTGPYAGRVIAFCNGGLNGGSTNTGLDIIDITNPGSPVRLGGMEYPGGAYSHQGWLTGDEQYYYINDELYSGSSSTFIVDVSDLTNPQFVTRYTNNNAAICHNLYVKGNLIYAANYRSGLRILDCSNPTSLVEVAYFDTYPGSDSASFNGAWSNYPFFDSGTVIVSDIERGLFVFSPDAASVSFDIVGGLPNPVASSGQVVDVEITVSGAELDTSSALALVNDGTGQQDIPMSYLGGSAFRVALPDLACPGSVSVSFAIQTLKDGELFQSTSSSSAVADGVEVTYTDNGETNLGFTVSGDATDGQWDRGVPVACERGDPGTDGDGSGQCWLTDNSSAANCNSDVDGGATVLTSGPIDTTGGEAYIGYDCWYDNSFGADPGNDVFVAEISNNGTDWVVLEVVGPTGARSSGGWNRVDFRVSDYVTPSTSVRLRFTAEDANDGSVIEAGIDGISVTLVTCNDSSDPSDVNGDGCINGADLTVVLGDWGNTSGPADINNDGTVNGADISFILGSWGLGCG